MSGGAQLELSELQAGMTQALRAGAALEREQAWLAFAAEHIAGNSRLSPVQQLEIYREQFWLRHTSSLLEDFPGLSGILGQQDWQTLAEQYLLEPPPASYTLRDLGRGLPELIARSSWLPHAELCLDMARLELAYIEVFDAEDTPPLRPERLAAVPEAELPRALLVIAPAVRLLQVRHPVAELRRALRTESDEPVPIPQPEAQNLVVYRRDLRLWDMKLSATAFALLSALRDGEALGAAAERASSSSAAEAEVAENIGAWFGEWTRKGLVQDIRLP